MVESFRRIALLVASAAVVFSVSFGVAYADDLSVSRMSAQEGISGSGAATLTTDGKGVATMTISIAQAGVYSISSTASTGVDCDTVGYLYDGSSRLVGYNDNRHADPNFCIAANLDAGTYTLQVSGKQHETGASITVSVVKATQMSAVDCKYAYNGTTMSSFELGTWAKSGAKTTWSPLATSAFSVVGYADRSIFEHAAEHGAVGNIKWKSGTPNAYGSFVLKVAATGSDASYVGDAFYFVENLCTVKGSAQYYEYDLGTKDVQVAYAGCGGVSSIMLGWEAVETPNRNTYWTSVGTQYYTVSGHASRAALERTGDPDRVNWTRGLPNQEGEFVIKITASNVSKNQYFGTRYVWVNLEGLSHAGSGKWVVDKKATYKSEGSRHLVCKYCGGACNVSSIPKQMGAKVGATVKAGSGAAKASYKIGKDQTAAYVKPSIKSSAKSVTVPDTVTVNGEVYAITSISPKAFSGFSKLKTVTVKAANLTKKGVKNSLVGSTVAVVTTPKSLVADYGKFFAAGNSGKSVIVK